MRGLRSNPHTEHEEMALTGLKINKLLPGTNCKECGSNTCLAFSMKLAAKKAALSACPYASEEAKRVLGAAAEPPVRGVGLGPDRSTRIGAETVLYRHEKTFVNGPALAIAVRADDPPDEVKETCHRIRGYELERVGEKLAIDMVCVDQGGADPAAFAATAASVLEGTGRPLVLRSSDPAALSAAASAVRGSGSVLASATPETAQELAAVAGENGHILSVTAPSLDTLVVTTEELKAAGYDDLILEFQTHSLAERFQTQSISRAAALKHGFKPLGYPSLHMLDDRDPADLVVEAVTTVCKYGGICVLPRFDSAQIAVFMTLRLNIFTDPQKPIQVEPALYPVGEPTAESPVFVTTNFSLTYFLVSGEIENSGISAWLLVPECEGMSVLTAWAAGKFDGATIGKFCREQQLEERVACRTIILPGYVASISGELEDALPGWTVLVGPQEAGDIEGFVQTRLAVCQS